MDWSDENIDKFKRELQSDVVKDSLYNFTTTHFESADDASITFSSILSKIYISTNPSVICDHLSSFWVKFDDFARP